ncbi:MAG: cell division protein SepF [Clostridiales bacterium]|nr:cell division protein SepF [Clostridiales bacterium]
MPNIFKNFLNSMKLTEDDGFDDDFLDDDIIESKSTLFDKKSKNNEFDEKPRRQPKVHNEYKKERVRGVDRSSAGKVVPIRTTPKGLEVCIMKPTSFDDSQLICDMILTGRATVINLEGFDDKLAQRTMDFVSGSVYAINGKLHRISNSIFIVSPDTVDISGDYLDMIRDDDNFDPPTINTRF